MKKDLKEIDSFDITPDDLTNPINNETYKFWLDILKTYWFKIVGGSKDSRIGTFHVYLNPEDKTIELTFKPRFSMPELDKIFKK